MISEKQMHTAIVIKATGSCYTLYDLASKATVEARLRGKLRLSGSRSTSPVVVGDIVDYEPEVLTGDQASTVSADDASNKNEIQSNETASETTVGEDRSIASAQLSSDKAETEALGSSVPAAPVTRMTGTIVALHPRRNYIIRRASNLSKESHIIAANIDRAFLVVSLVYPTTNNEFIDRFLVTAEAYHIPVTVLLNKSDLYNTPELEQQRDAFIATYTHAGYDVIEMAAARGDMLQFWAGRDFGDGSSRSGRACGLEIGVSVGERLDPLRKLLRGNVNLLSGNSGVGKSTLIRAIDPTLDVRVGEVSDAHHKGKHTTTFSEMYPLEDGGWLIDTPGIKGFGLIDLEGAEIARYFPELFHLAPQCAYYNCTHTHEPGCAVKQALERGEVSPSRYESYLKLLEDDEKYRR